MQDDLQKAVNERLIEEMARLKMEKVFTNESEFLAKYNLPKSTMSNIRRDHTQAGFQHLEKLSLCPQFDYSYVVTGIRAIENKDIKMAVFDWMQKTERELQLVQRKLHKVDTIYKKVKMT